ncbi:MAG TPA: MFS transporter [Mycobacteriales bacterium]|jgi:MFS family permease|nr:MFS transporter [Mycobacteriales bacterium]
MLPGAVGAVPATRVRKAFIGTLALANLAVWMGFFTPIQLLLPQQLEDITGDDGKVAALGWVSGAGALVAVLATPLAGALSDRTTSRFGRRLPWLVGGTVFGALGLIVLSRQSTVAGVLIGWCVAQAFLNSAYAGLTAEVPDHVPVAQRGTVSGWFGLPQAVGVVVGVALVTSFTTTAKAGYLLIAVVIAVLVLPFAFVTRDAPLVTTPPRPTLKDWWIDPRTYPDFGWAWLTRFLISLGNALGTLYLLYFLRDKVHYEQLFPGKSAEDGVLILILIYAAGAVATAVGGGIWSDRTGRRKPLVIVSSLVMAVGALLLAIWPTWTASIVAAALLGIGYGVYMAVDTALVTEVLPAATDRGKDLGIVNIANAAPQVLAPALAAPIVAGLGGYPVLYILTALVTLAGAVLVLPIRSVR